MWKRSLEVVDLALLLSLGCFLTLSLLLKLFLLPLSLAWLLVLPFAPLLAPLPVLLVLKNLGELAVFLHLQCFFVFVGRVLARCGLVVTDEPELAITADDRADTLAALKIYWEHLGGGWRLVCFVLLGVGNPEALGQVDFGRLVDQLLVKDAKLAQFVVSPPV